MSTPFQQQKMTKYIQLDDWIFEIKAVRALRVSEYGQAYSSIANININGDSAYIDGLMSRENEVFTRKDFNTIIEFCQQLGLETAAFDRFKNGALVSEVINLKKRSTAMLLQLAT